MKALLKGQVLVQSKWQHRGGGWRLRISHFQKEGILGISRHVACNTQLTTHTRTYGTPG